MSGRCVRQAWYQIALWSHHGATCGTTAATETELNYLWPPFRTSGPVRCCRPHVEDLCLKEITCVIFFLLIYDIIYTEFLHDQFSEEPLHHRERLKKKKKKMEEEESSFIYFWKRRFFFTKNSNLNSAPDTLHLTKCVRCHWSQRTPCTEPGSHTVWSCDTNRRRLQSETTTTTTTSWSGSQAPVRWSRPSEGAHLQ